MGPASSRRTRVERGIYRQPNGKYAVCCRHAGRLRFRTVGFDLVAARRERLALIAAVRRGEEPVAPRLLLETVAGWWLERFEAMVAAGDRHPRTLEAHRYHLDRHLVPAMGRRLIASVTVDDVAELLDSLRRKGCSPKTSASALATLESMMRFARRHGWIVADPVERLEHDERPRPQPRRQRVLGRAEIERLLAASSPRSRLMIATVLYTGLRISEMLGLVWDDVDLRAGVIHVRAQLSRAHRGAPAQSAGLNSDGWPPLRFHDLRHTFASHLIVDLGLDVAQVSRILGHARVTITLDTYTHLFEDARHARDIRTRMAASPFAGLLETATAPGATVVRLRQGRPSAGAATQQCPRSAEANGLASDAFL